LDLRAMNAGNCQAGRRIGVNWPLRAARNSDE
jgi:hypothetical protein